MKLCQMIDRLHLPQNVVIMVLMIVSGEPGDFGSGRRCTDHHIMWTTVNCSSSSSNIIIIIIILLRGVARILDKGRLHFL